MTMTEALGRVQQIQLTLTELAATRSARPQPGAGADEFARALAASGAKGGASPVAVGAATGADLTTAAAKYLGVPYVFGGEDASGMDCSGLVQRAFADLGIDVPRLVSGQAKLGTEVASLAEAQPGDLIVTRGGEHIAIYLGDDKIIHAPRPGKDVRIVDVYMSDAEIDTIRRVVPAQPMSPIAAGISPAGSAKTDLVAAAQAAFIPGRTS